MTDQLSALTLQYTATGNPDFPVVTILVNGTDPFASTFMRQGGGFLPTELLGEESPLLPLPHVGRRVAVTTCECGFAGCGVAAPVIQLSADGRRVHWIDFRDYVGMFGGPVYEDIEQVQGQPLEIPDLVFDAEQYLAEVRRASEDDSWLTPRRRTSLLLRDAVRARNPVLPPDLTLGWVSPAWGQDGFVLSFGRRDKDKFKQVVLRLCSPLGEGTDAVEDLVERLFAVDPEEWELTFAWRPR